MKFGPLSIVFFLMSSAAVWAAPGNDRAGFAALHGAAAANYQLPGDVRFMHSRALRGGLLTANRYQQRVGAAEVLGGQLTVLKAANGDVTAVIGAHYPGLLSTNDIVLKARAAQGIAASKIGGAGQWRTQLMINPADGRYFYLVENRRADSRWFHWIDAEDGAVVNAYDGLTTGSGIGVDGTTKDLTDLTTWNGNTYEMVSADDRQTTYDAGGKNRLPGRLATDDDNEWITPGRTSPGQAALVDAHFFANVTDDYLLAPRL